MPLPNLLIPHNLPNFLDILYATMVKCPLENDHERLEYANVA